MNCELQDKIDLDKIRLTLVKKQTDLTYTLSLFFLIRITGDTIGAERDRKCDMKLCFYMISNITKVVKLSLVLVLVFAPRVFLQIL